MLSISEITPACFTSLLSTHNSIPIWKEELNIDIEKSKNIWCFKFNVPKTIKKKELIYQINKFGVKTELVNSI